MILISPYRVVRHRGGGFTSCPWSARASRPGKSRARRAQEESRPLSRVLSWTAIPLGCASPRSSSSLPGSLMWATWCGQRHRVLPYLVLLQVGFAMPSNVATDAVRSYRTVSPLPHGPLPARVAVYSLLHFPWARAPQALPGTLPCGARTFLHVLAHTATAWPTLGAHHTWFSADAPVQRGLRKAPKNNGIDAST